MSNYYEVLGVSKDANETEIKKAYRQLSLKYHPDRNSSEEAKDRIQQVNQAYEILSDEAARQNYDLEQTFGPNGRGGGHHHGMGGHPFENMDDFADVHNMFNMMFGGGGGGFPGMPGMPGMHGMPGGGMPNIRIFRNGQMFNVVHKPDPIISHVQLTIEQSFHGCNLPIEIERIIFANNVKSVEKETLYINIQPGIDDNEQLTIADKGNVLNDTKGEIKIVIKIVNETPFQRNGLDLIYNKNVTLKECLCGFSFDMVHLNGKKLCINNVSNPTVIKPNFKKIIPSMGMIRDNSIGNMIIHFDVEFPDILSQEQIIALSAIL